MNFTVGDKMEGIKIEWAKDYFGLDVNLHTETSRVSVGLYLASFLAS